METSENAKMPCSQADLPSDRLGFHEFIEAGCTGTRIEASCISQQSNDQNFSLHINEMASQSELSLFEPYENYRFEAGTLGAFYPK